MNTALRRIGVNVLGDMPWGAHVCMFYQSKDDLFDTVGPYFNRIGQQRTSAPKLASRSVQFLCLRAAKHIMGC